jgi:hypothetical protein
MFKKLKEKIKNITPKQAIVGALAGTAGIIISAPLAVAVGAGYLVKTIKDVKEENRIEQENLEKEKLMRSQITQEKIDEKLQVKLPTLDDNSIPESFICPITQNIMSDPVVTPYGISYEKSAIEDWLNKNNNDPIAQKPLKKEDLVRNYALKGIIEDFIKKKENENKNNNNQENNNQNIDNNAQNNNNNVIINDNNNLINNGNNNGNVIEKEEIKNEIFDEEKKNEIFEEEKKNEIIVEDKKNEIVIEEENVEGKFEIKEGVVYNINEI